MCVLLVAVFFINPLYFTGHHPNIIGGHTPGNMRTLSSVDDLQVSGDDDYVVGFFWWGVVCAVRLLVAAVCFGWVHIRSLVQFGSLSTEGVKFWRFWKQAQQDLHKVAQFLCSFSQIYSLSLSARVSMGPVERVWSQLWQLSTVPSPPPRSLWHWVLYGPFSHTLSSRYIYQYMHTHTHTLSLSLYLSATDGAGKDRRVLGLSCREQNSSGQSFGCREKAWVSRDEQ